MIVRNDLSYSLSSLCALYDTYSHFLLRSSQVQPVTLPEVSDQFPGGSPARVSGWGITESGKPSDVLKAVDIKIVSDAGDWRQF